MKIKALTAVAIVAFVFLTTFEARAVPIVGLQNTGASSSAGGQDTNYALTKTGGDGPAISLFGIEGTNIHPAWLANTTTSQWLTPTANASQTFDAGSNGIYTYTLTFDLTGFDASTASFDGRWAIDNSATMTLNSTSLLNSAAGFGSWSSFSSAGGIFFAGLNTLDFTVTNNAQSFGNPTGLRVEFLNSNVDATSAPVPEPSTLLLLGSGLVGLIVFGKKKGRIHR